MTLASRDARRVGQVLPVQPAFARLILPRSLLQCEQRIQPPLPGMQVSLNLAESLFSRFQAVLVLGQAAVQGVQLLLFSTFPAREFHGRLLQLAQLILHTAGIDRLCLLFQGLDSL